MSAEHETAAQIAGRLGLRRIGRMWAGACPACGYPKGLRLSEKNGRPLWWCASCQDREALSAAVLGHSAPAAPRALPAPDRSAEADDRRAAALRLWDAALPPDGTTVEWYLRGRGLALPGGASLRYLGQAKHPSGKRLPCMVALLHDVTGRPVAVHRTFLQPAGEGKAAVDPQRMTLGNVRGAAVRLHQVADRLVIAEGIETALAAAELLRMPAWAAVSAGNLGETLQLPEAIRDVVIAADHDAPGRRAAQQAAARWKREGRTVRIALPDKAGADFNDVLQERRARG